MIRSRKVQRVEVEWKGKVEGQYGNQSSSAVSSSVSDKIKLITLLLVLAHNGPGRGGDSFVDERPLSGHRNDAVRIIIVDGCSGRLLPRGFE